jgi:hypothetical protein
MRYPVLVEEKEVRQVLDSVVIDSCHLVFLRSHSRRKVYPFACDEWLG